MKSGSWLYRLCNYLRGRHEYLICVDYREIKPASRRICRYYVGVLTSKEHKQIRELMGEKLAFRPNRRWNTFWFKSWKEFWKPDVQRFYHKELIAAFVGDWEEIYSRPAEN